jgi:hypothetical protein
MTLMNQEMIAQYVERDSGQVHFEQTSCLVASIACEPFITPAMDMCEPHDSNLNESRKRTNRRRLFLL